MTRDEFIVEVWEGLGKEVVGASELGVIESALVERFGIAISPASIARVLADHGERLGHPEILKVDAQWRETQLLLTADELEFDNLDAARKLIDKIQQFGSDPTTRRSVRSLKSELDSLSSSNQLAAEVAQWLAVWLQNPEIFAEWLALRQNTPEFHERFLS